jgi:MSHA biogenesis protein MshN
MSVINKVLRDLDKRQGTASAAAVELGSVRSGTTSVLTHERTVVRSVSGNKTRWSILLPCTLVALALVGAALWQSAPVAPPPAVVTPVAVAVAASVPSVPAASTAARAPASHFDSSLAVRKDTRPAAVVLSAPAPVKPPVQVAVAPIPVVAAVVASAPLAPSDVEPPPVPASAPVAAELAQKQQLAGRDALAHAQTLWNGGSRDAAVDMLQQAVASAERAATSTPSPANTQTLVLLVREFGRMQLSEGRPGVVWETLTRLEPVLRDQPEMWALRANAAQRMGRHQDSVHAYMTALQSRPTEQRWLLGTAVSLAALGQTTSATEMAEKASAAGPISKEVQTYLRQMGVQLRD